MKIVKTIKEVKEFINSYKKQGKKISFVPTMGCLHEGHLSLIRKAKELGDCVVVSIFVNSLQFGENEDFSKYPRKEKEDIKLLEDLKIDLVFMPKESELYPKNFSTYVEVKGLSCVLCGKTRPSHFTGVATIVLKFLHIIEPDILLLGQKDAQQAQVIRRMINDLNLNVDVIMMPIIREKDGLAMSSRNNYLNKNQRKDACIIYESLCLAEELINKGESSAEIIRNEIINILQKVDYLVLDYVSIVNYQTLEYTNEIKDNTLIAIAVFLDKTRLIDNIIVRKK